MQIGSNVSDRTTVRDTERYAGTGKDTGSDFQDFIRDKMEEIFVKVINGETETKYQIGSQAFTEKEWDRLLESFDSAQDAIKEMMREEHAKRLKQYVNKTEIKNSVDSDTEDMLLSEMTACTCPASNPGEEDIRYITWYTQEGIFCREAGQTGGYEWSVPFESSEQYDKVMEFIRQFSSEDNLTFASQKDFWMDFLNDKIDLEEFAAPSAIAQ